MTESVAFTELDDEAVLLNAETGMYYGLNPLGTRVWSLLVTGATEPEICRAVLAEYDAEPERVTADVANLVSRLIAEGLIEVTDGASDLERGGGGPLE